MALPLVTADTTRIYNEDLVTTAEHIQPGIVENAINAHPAMSVLYGNIGEIMNGDIGNTGAGGSAESATGDSIRINVKLGKNGSAQWLPGGFSEFSTDTSNTARGGRANWVLAGASVIISGSQKRRNSGDAQIVNQLVYKQTDATTALVDTVAEALLTTSSLPNAITSIPTLISADDSVQSLSGSTFQNWNSRGRSAKSTASGTISFQPATTSFSTAGIGNWRVAYMNAEEGSIKPNVIITTDLLYRSYEGALTPQVRYADPRVGDLSFESLRFKGASVFHDPFAATGGTYFLNTRFLTAKYLPGALFNISPMIEQDAQDAFSAKVLFEGQLTISGRKYNNKLTGQTA